MPICCPRLKRARCRLASEGIAGTDWLVIANEWSLVEVSEAIVASWGPETMYVTREPGDRVRALLGS